MKTLKALLAIFLAFSLSISDAQVAIPGLPTGVLVSPNLISPSMQGTTITGATNINGAGGVSGGSTPGYIQSTNTIAFGYTTGTVAYNYAFNQALQNAGLSILGYNYSGQYLNQDYSSGTLNATFTLNALNGTPLYTNTINLGPTTGGWTTMSGTQTFVNPFSSSIISGLTVSFTGKDDRYWAGYYGPQVQNPSLTLNYTVNQCATNPLSNPSCPGYAAAYQTQQCNANPLY